MWMKLLRTLEKVEIDPAPTGSLPKEIAKAEDENPFELKTETHDNSQDNPATRETIPSSQGTSNETSQTNQYRELPPRQTALLLGESMTRLSRMLQQFTVLPLVLAAFMTSRIGT